ncbi:hypothetical protein [Sulfuritortus calidifontis]|uniref:hypothetical protein n=1 Tax=Sulfuritortus calidifontis TaxID=1914471 RepID=UPI000F8332A1|nr:hypothetical protein [Sulfuritortus calidifontis]
MCQSILSGLFTGALLVAMPAAAFLLWAGGLGWIVMTWACVLILGIVLGIAEGVGWRWPRMLGRILFMR